MAISLERERCRLRELLGDISPAEFARRMGVHRSTVTRWMNGERDMTYEDTVLAGRILGHHAEEFYTFKEIPRDSKRRKE
ncbi:helix-turn-helix domain-containing protein [Paenibacillus sp. GYB004]|uniref:helix-turn-helix domain-containing protein n=1 Tax=Paenibacillus sp. GYB004 TaxID=2994393 RepID=UPI003FA76A64